MGKRLLKKRLLSPITNPHKLEHRFCQLDEFGSLFDSFVKTFGRLLANIANLEQLHRRLLLEVLTLHKLARLYTSYVAILDLCNLLSPTFSSLDEISNSKSFSSDAILNLQSLSLDETSNSKSFSSDETSNSKSFSSDETSN
ncbi:hypothetical protein K7432_018178 [Basidiobolus ranarum]|uniref:Spindle pole body component n=1 Tax=Basidiobolus ranarum TaxID=34480 RepID=A0ABR2VJP0_9FUNG